MEYNIHIKEMTETVIGKDIISQVAKMGEVTPDKIKDLILSDYNGEMCKEFIRVLRFVVQSREELQDFVENERELIRAL
jgi:hypothetical protein|tara:strand:+ start:45 stop:281 length:237 start_codon:yes stop_codon:yes gene_type:complete